MTEQMEILKWFHEEHSEKDLSPKEAFQKYQEQRGYNSSQKTFNNLLGKLAKKGLLEKPERGRYRISENGKNKANFIKKQDLDQLPEDESNYQQIVEDLTFFLEERKQKELEKAYSGLYTLKIELSEIEKFKLDIAEYFEDKPEKFLEALEESVETASEYEEKVDYSFKVDVDYYETDIFKARDAINIGKVITIEGTISSASEFYPEVIGAIFECVQCGERYYKEQHSSELKKPFKCDCGSRKFDTVEKDTVNRVDLRLSDRNGYNGTIKAARKENKLDERVQKAFKPGKSIRLSGVIKEKENGKTNIDPYLEAVDFRDEVTEYLDTIDEEDREDIQERIRNLENPFYEFSSSLAPDIVCEEESKQVIAASLIGAEGKNQKDGRIHSFIVSNPGKGKSDLLKFVKEVFQDTFLSDGKNSSGPGLIGAIEQDDGKFVFNAGKLVQADEGVLLIDEFDKMDPDQATALNRPMSHGTIELDKGSENLEGVPAKASIMAAGNFTEYLDDFSHAKSHLPEHAESLMDRWDLKLAVREKGKKERDKINSAILRKHSETGIENEPEFSEKELVVYRELARDTEAFLTESALEAIDTWLQGNLEVAGAKGNSNFQTESRRHIETLAKLTKMFAKSEFREEANMSDAKRAIRLFSMCKSSMGLTDGESWEDSREEVKV